MNVRIVAFFALFLSGGCGITPVSSFNVEQPESPSNYIWNDDDNWTTDRCDWWPEFGDLGNFNSDHGKLLSGHAHALVSTAAVLGLAPRFDEGWAIVDLCPDSSLLVKGQPGIYGIDELGNILAVNKKFGPFQMWSLPETYTANDGAWTLVAFDSVDARPPSSHGDFAFGIIGRKGSLMFGPYKSFEEAFDIWTNNPAVSPNNFIRKYGEHYLTEIRNRAKKK